MPKSNRPRKQHQPKTHNAAEPPPFKTHNVDKSAQYAGAARFIEIGPPGIQFRGLTNIDHITSITFGNKIEDVQVRDEDAVDIPEVVDAEGKVVSEAIPAPTHTEKHVTGFTVAIGIAGQQNEFTFSRIEVGIAYYNELLNMIATVGAPVALKPRLQPPPPLPIEDTILVGADGKPLKDEGDIDADYTDDGDDPLIEELEDLADEMAEDEIAEEDTPTIQ